MTQPVTLRATCPTHGPGDFVWFAPSSWWQCTVTGCVAVITAEAFAANPDGGDVVLWPPPNVYFVADIADIHAPTLAELENAIPIGTMINPERRL